MILKNITLAIRHIMRYRAYSILNIIGLAIGMASAMLIILWVNNEISIDKFHKNGKNIYQLRTGFTYSNGQIDIGEAVTSPLIPAISAEVPEIISAIRVTWLRTRLFRVGEKSYFEKGYYADSSFFSVFSFKFIKGDSSTALNKPTNVTISDKLAIKLFGKENPIGKTIAISDNNVEEIFLVTGVFANISKHSSIQFDYVIPFSKISGNNFNHWGNFNLQAFILTKNHTNNKYLNEKITQILSKNRPGDNERTKVIVQPFEDVYLYNNYQNRLENPTGRIMYIKIFSIVAMFIIFLACLNYTNLATALAIKRAKEVGIKKAYGSGKKQLVIQFALEALVLTLIGFFISIIIVECVLPFFNELIGTEIVFNYNNLGDLRRFILVPIVTGLFAGAFPAFYISSFKPISVLKNIFRPHKGTIHFSQILVIFQFVITIAFIISSFVILKQIRFIQNKTLGLDKDNIIYFDQSQQIKKQRTAFKTELKNQSGIINATFTDDNPLGIGSDTSDPTWRGKSENDTYSFPFIQVDQEFCTTFGAEIIAGRDFSSDFPSDTNCIIINQEALKLLKFENPIGEIVSFWGRKATIIGVVKDFHFYDLHLPIRQLIIICSPNRTDRIMVKIQGNMRKQAIANVEKVFRNFESNTPFEYKFLDEEFAKNYDGEKYMSRFSNLFAILAIIISCLGLFGLALFTAEQKTKEIGIRKSIGAKTYEVVLLLARDFLKWIAIAYVIACIVAYFVLNAWLQNFAYRTEISWWIFVITGLITAAIALITVSWQSYRAASKNPVDCLRYE
jgi:putative ABC transport system permease protein